MVNIFHVTVRGHQQLRPNFFFNKIIILERLFCLNDFCFSPNISNKVKIKMNQIAN